MPAERFDFRDAENTAPGTVVLRETRHGKFQQEIASGAHRLMADEPVNAGGLDSGPGPYDLLLAALGACTSMTLRLYADRKQLPLTRVQVQLRHKRIYATDCAECETKEGMIDRIERVITLEGALECRAARAAHGNRRQVSGAPDAAIRDRHPHGGGSGWQVTRMERSVMREQLRGGNANPGFRSPLYPGYRSRALAAAMTSGIAASLPGAMMWMPAMPGIVDSSSISSTQMRTPS